MDMCCLEIQKIKSVSQLKSKFNHNYRIADVENADKAREKFNIELVKNEEHPEQYDVSDKENAKDFVKRWKERIGGLDYYDNHSIRKNAVIAYEVNMTYSPTADVPIQEWQSKNMEWLHQEFDKATDGGSNILSAVYHGDENNGHIHAIVVPIDSKGRLNSQEYTNGYAKMVHLQDSYAEAMSEFNLDRGARGSSLTHSQVRKFYADANRILNSMPEPEPDQTADEYFRMYREQMEAAYSSRLMQAKKKSEEKIRKADQYFANQKDKQIQEKRKELEEIKLEVRNKNNELKKLSSNIVMAEQSLEELSGEITKYQEYIKSFEDPASENSMKVAFYDDFFKKYEIAGKENPDMAQRIDDLLLDMDSIKDGGNIEDPTL